ncbi:hypothetical protein JCM5350_005192 [Sporobolomyces pararoseus]
MSKSGGGLHRRTSSAALHYSSLPGSEGQDISLYTSSAAPSTSKRPTTTSSSHHSTVSVSITPEEQDGEMQSDEEKASLLSSDSPKLSRSPSKSRGGGRRKSKCRIVLLLMVLTSTAIILYAVVTGWIEKRDVEKVWGDWKDWTKKQQENWNGGASTITLEQEDISGGGFNSTDASSIESLLAAKGRPQQASSATSSPTLVESAILSHPSIISLKSSAKNSTTVTNGYFATSRMQEINQMVDSGNLSVYRWHESLPALTSSSYLKSLKDQSRRLIVIGDLHGTHRSLFALLRKISYTPSHDVLLHTGDILSKSTLDNSLATIKLLRKIGARGVRGNHDQKVLEWRKWMETLGPLDQSKEKVFIEEDDKELATDEISQEYSTRGSSGSNRLEAAEYEARDGTPRWKEEEEKRKMRMRSSAPRSKEKRDWLNWLSSTNTDEEETGSIDEGEVLETGDEGNAATAATHYDEAEEQTLSSSSTRPSPSRVTDSRRPFGQRPARLPSSTSHGSSPSSPARPSGSLSKSTSNPMNTTLLGPLYSHLEPSLSKAQRSSLGIQVPTTWEWGGEHFEIARHLSKEDVDYLESLPLTLYVEELKSFVVHAGVVPWTETPTEAFTPLSSSLSSSLAVSTSETSFVPSSKTYRSLLSTLQGSLLLVPQNTDPFTLLNLRTLSHVRSTPDHRTGRVKVKGPADQWKVSSKSRKAGKNSQPWWSVWESALKDYEIENGNEESVGVIYGHWASQGLQLQNHSIGLDSGCVYGKKLSALVLDLASDKSPLSPLTSSTTSEQSSDKLSDPSSTSTKTTPSSSSTTARARPTLEQGGRFDRVIKPSSSPVNPRLSVTQSTSAFDSTVVASPTTSIEEGAAGSNAWWKPWKRSTDEDDEDSEGDEEADYTGYGEEGEEEMRLGKRAPPQFRPMGGLNEEKILAAAAGESLDSSSSTSHSSSSSTSTPLSATTTALKKQKKRPQQKFGKFTSSLTPPSSSASSTSSISSESMSIPSESSYSTSISPSSTSTPKSRTKVLSSSEPEEIDKVVTDEDEDDDDNEFSMSDSQEEDEDEEQQDLESMFSAQQTDFTPLGQKVWIVSVDCGIEVAMDTE